LLQAALLPSANQQKNTNQGFRRFTEQLPAET